MSERRTSNKSNVTVSSLLRYSLSSDGACFPRPDNKKLCCPDAPIFIAPPGTFSSAIGCNHSLITSPQVPTAKSVPTAVRC